jgi:tripeptidyl-peptidase-1
MTVLAVATIEQEVSREQTAGGKAAAVEARRLRDRMVKRESFQWHRKADPLHEHEVVIGITPRNADVIERTLLELSDPSSPTYQQWWTREKVMETIDNPVGYAAVEEWLLLNHVRIERFASSRHYIRAVATVGKWEELLHTEFHVWHDSHPQSAARGRGIDPETGQPRRERNDVFLVRAEHYSVPEHLNDHIKAIFETSQSPAILTKGAAKRRQHKGRDSKKPVENSRHQQEQSEGEAQREGEGEGLNEGEAQRRLLLAVDGTVTPPFLNQLYLVGSNAGDSSQSQSVFQTASGGNDPYYSSKDLLAFLGLYSCPSITPVNYPPGSSYDTQSCYAGKGGDPRIVCDEGNLDVQYLTAMSQGTRTVYWAEISNGNTDPFSSWAQAMSADLAGSKSMEVMVTSISFGATEQSMNWGSMEAFNFQAQILGIMGSTIIVASGDNGAPGTGMGGGCSASMCNEDTGSNTLSWSMPSAWSGAGYYPSFPATSPYVTAVGATMGPEMGLGEIACQSDKKYPGVLQNTAVTVSGIITSGGGFSTYFPQPSYQKAAVAKYFSRLKSQPRSGYNPNGRAYPDVALIGVRYVTVLGSPNQAYMFGTSASAPAFAGMISLINALRKKKGKVPIGFINPTLYTVGANNATFFRQYNISIGNTSAVFNDVVSGNNLCCSASDTVDPNPNNLAPPPMACCTSGFTTAVGWDPVTGWGSIPFTKFAAIFSVAAPYIPPAPVLPPTVKTSTTLSLWQILLLAALIISALGFLWYVGLYIYRFHMQGRTTAVATATATFPPQQQQQQQQQWQDVVPSPAPPGRGGQQWASVAQPIPQPTNRPLAIYGFVPDVQERPSGRLSQQAVPLQELEGCPRCGRGFIDAVALVDHVGRCTGR